jgi:ATP adenylyltransferase
MPRSGSRSRREQRPEPLRGALYTAVRTATARALASGSLTPLATRAHVVEDAGIHFSVRVVSSLASRPRPEPGRNPFLPYDEDLFVSEVGPDHVCLLNKYPVLRDHLLIVTRKFEEQESPLALRDFEALWSVLLEGDGLAFYNAGLQAGASQPHRHLQVVPTPLGPTPQRTPIDPVIDQARFDAAVGRAGRFPFHHAVARLRSLTTLPPGVAARGLHGLYREMARAFGCERAGRPYNLLVSRDWMLFIPRARESWQSISVNALGFAGALVVHDEAQLERVRAAGPMSLLEHVGVRV